MAIPANECQTFDTRDPDELAARLSSLFGRASLDLRGRNAPFRCRMKSIALGAVGLFHGQYENGFEIRFSEFNAFAGSPSPLSGAGAHEICGREVAVSKDNGAVLSPGVATLHYGANFEHLSMTVQPAALMGKLSAIVGDLRFGPLRFEPSVNGRDPAALRLDRLLRYVAAEAGQSSPVPPLLQSELQQSMMTAFLLANPNNYSRLLHGEPEAAAPWQVRIAEQFIEANWDQPVTIEGLTSAANVSARSLFSTFRSARGYSPMEFVKRVRLGRAWQKLSHPDANTSVSTVAFECGFGNPGHFAVDYRRQFGERPSETLRRGRN
ncbi:AraC family transcriptional regulator [Rhodoblastus sp. 17X3]|uniref:AraC family transcriptional regulator n=1 Tax=Rhodoblastus sp. 17X3 TaxID=3047026 RepID=UPI0024B7DF94|nr:AraC family transcriptional regulator [Rhodoblastus sp. 17X3]MDI9849895.1 AraC family transcriptional regulator [Rhodoblastus sp. 17X3]